MKNKRNVLGKVIFVQVQRVPLKRGEPGSRVYDPAGLERMSEVLLTPSGIVGVLDSGEQVVDAHHESHPQSRFRGLNGISVGFTTHYDFMRAQYGDHIYDGIAGENMIVQSEKAYTAEDLAGELVFENPDGSRCRMRLNQAMAPCDEYSHFVHKEKGRLPAKVLKETLIDLDAGRRGFTLVLDGTDSGRVLPGAILVLETQ